MSFTDLFESGTHRKNMGHFAAIASLAAKDGVVTKQEEDLMKRFAERLDITQEEYNDITKNPSKYPTIPPLSANRRLQRMLDFFTIIYIDHEMQAEELELLERYALAIGYTEEQSAKLIKKSIKIFSGGLDLEDYRYLVNRK